MNGSRIPRSVVALVVAVVGWAWLYSRLSDPPHVNRSPAALVATTPAQPTAPAKHLICGRALDAHGTPVAGATVCLTRAELSELQIPEPALIAQTQTRADGRFELARAPSPQIEQSAQNPVQEFEIWIWSPGFAVAHATVLPEERQPPLSISLVKQSSFTIRLQKPDHSPCAAAIVTPVLVDVAPDHPWLPIPIRKQLQTHVAPDGRVDIGGWKSGRMGVAIETEEFGVQTATLWPSAGESAAVALRGTRTVEGRVILPAGAKQDLSRLRLAVLEISRSDEADSNDESTPRDTGEASRVVWQDQREARPDRDGRFTFVKLPNARRGTLHLKAVGLSAVGLADDRDSGCRLEDLPTGKILKIDLPVRKGVWVTWVARDAYTKQPLAGVPIKLMSSSEFTCSGTTDKDGQLRICLAPGETYRVDCQLPDGYVRSLFGADAYVEIPTGSATFELPPIELVRVCSLEGRAVDATRRPLKDVRIRANWHTRETKLGKQPAEITQCVVTDRLGHFRFEQVEAGASVLLASARAGIPFAEPIQTVAGDGKEVRLQAQERDLVALTGRVLGGDGKPLVGAQVVVEVADSPDALGQFRATVESDGSFRTPPQFPRQLRYRLTVRSLLKNVASSAWLCPASAGNRFPDRAVDPSKISPGSKLLGTEVVARINGQPICASELLERAAVEPLNADRLTLLSAGNNLASGAIAEEEFRALQEMAIKKFLPGFVRTRLQSQGYCSQLDPEQMRRSEEAVDREFEKYVVKLEADFQVQSPQGVDEKLRHQGTSLASLKAEFRYRLYADEYLRGMAQHVGPVDRPQLLAYYQAHHDQYAIPEKVTWQLLEIGFDHQRFKSPKTTNHAPSTDSWMALYKQIGREAGVADKEIQPASFGAVVPGSLFDQSRPNAADNKRTAETMQLAEADSVSDSADPDAHQDGFVWSDEMREFYGRKNGLKVLEDALARLEKGESFAAVAKQFSDGPRAEQGGWQRPTRPDSIVDGKTAAILHQLAEGETSSVIETDHAFRVIRLVTRMPAGWIPFEDVEKTIRQQLNQARSQQALDVLASRATIESAFPLDDSWKRLPSPANSSPDPESVAP